MIRDVTELEVYQVSMSLVKLVYQITSSVTYAERGTVDQIRRSAKSVPANIAEGFGKRSSPKEFKRYLSIALGSSDETIVHLRLLYVAVPRLRSEIAEIANQYKVLSKRINKLRTSWLTDKLEY
jgi:four helix bundle protein